MVVALTVERPLRENDLVEVIDNLSDVVPAKAGTHTPRPLSLGRWKLISSVNNQQLGFWVPAFAGTTR
jgi:hypothetical protein